jgi:hypothetical protein
LNFNFLFLSYSIKIDFEFVSDPAPVTTKENDADAALGDLESRFSEILSQTTKEDDEFQAQQEIYTNVNSNAINSRFFVYHILISILTLSHAEENLLQVQRELNDCERKVSLMKMIVTETKELQDLTIYPYNY